MYDEEKLDYVRKIYQEVVKEFPDTKEDEIEIIYNPYGDYIAGYMTFVRDMEKALGIIVGKKFFSLNGKERRGAMAHEIGHHETEKNFTIPRLERHRRWFWRYGRDMIPDSRPHWKERLKKWYILNEISANNKAAKTKYGKYLLSYYKKRIKPSNEIGQILIKNLEQKLGEENE